MALEEKLRKIRQELLDGVREKELEQSVFYERAHQLLVEAGILRGEEDYPGRDVVRVVNRLDLPVEYFAGIENAYVVRDGEVLSEEARRDIELRSQILEETERYLRETISGPVPKSEYESRVRDYLSQRDELRHLGKFSRELFIAHATGTLWDRFDIVEDPERLGNYTIDELEAAVERIGGNGN